MNAPDEPGDAAFAARLADIERMERETWGRVSPSVAWLISELRLATAEAARLRSLLNTPETRDFLKAVELEAAHQVARWGTAHDAGKTDADWFWLIGYLAGKALHNPPNAMDPIEARLHRIVTVAAAARNWHGAVLGQNDMRPGIATPREIEGRV